MAEYLAHRIIDGALDYSYVISKKPLLKNEIDLILTNEGYSELIK